MKKIFIALLILTSLSPASYAASSEDIYVRQDVFDAKMEALFTRLDAKIDSAISELRGDIKALSARIDGLETRVDERFNSLDKRMDSMDKRIDHTNTFLYYLLVLLGALILLPPVSRWFEAKKEINKSVTIEDVRKLIEENNEKLSKIFEPKVA